MEENEDVEEDEDVDDFPDLAVSQTQRSQLSDHQLDDVSRNEEQTEGRNDAGHHQIDGMGNTDHSEACIASGNSAENTIQRFESAPGFIERLDENENRSVDIRHNVLLAANLLHSTIEQSAKSRSGDTACDAEDSSMQGIDDADYSRDDDGEDADIIDMCVVDTQQSMADIQVECDQYVSKDSNEDNTRTSLIYWEQAAPDPVEVVDTSTIKIVPGIVPVSRSSESSVTVTSPLGDGFHYPGAHSPITPLFPYTVESQTTLPPLFKQQLISELDSVAGAGSGTKSGSLQSNDPLDGIRLTGSQSSSTQFTPVMNIYSEGGSQCRSQGQFNSLQCAQNADERNAIHSDPKRAELESSKTAAASLKDSALSASSSFATKGSGSVSASVCAADTLPVPTNVPANVSAFFKAGKVLTAIPFLEANLLSINPACDLFCHFSCSL